MKLNKLCALMFLTISGLNAQDLDVNLQLRPRYEYRNGFKELMKDQQYPASFVSQRSRLNFNYKQDNLKAKLTLQNVKIWGDAATTATSDKNGIMLFEAWAQYDFNSKWSTRIGRQVLSYDNQRFMGEIDWIQQGQSHDAALITFKPNKHQLDLGFALNNDADKLYKELYITSYKHMQYAWYHTDFSKFGLSLLFSNVGYEFKTDVIHEDLIQTAGTHFTFKSGKWDAFLSAYGQFGESKLVDQNTTVNAMNAAINLNYAVTDKFKAGLGFECLSGKDQDDTSSKIKSFYPLFGTNHAFNGLMDYFYVGNHKNSVGLQDFYLKFGYTSNKWKFDLVPHAFMTAAKVVDPIGPNKYMDDYLGTEIDFVTTYAFKKDITISGGYSQMFGTKTLEQLKGGNIKNDNNWVWIMININPRIFSFSSKQ